MSSPRIAFSKEFLESYSKLPRNIQKKTREFTEKFQRDPTQLSLNFEHLSGAVDSKVRSARIDQAYRAIVIHPPKGDVYLCVWVDHHDEAYRWVQNRKFEVNPRSGSFQIFGVDDTSLAPSMPEAVDTVVETAPKLFDEIDDEDLLLAGVPEPLLVSVRALRGDADLDELAPHLPSDAADLLYLLAAGYSLLDAIEETERAKPEAVVAIDTEDFEAALERPVSQQQFAIVENEAELESMLDAPLDQWRIFLHPSQRKLVRMNANGPVRVLGGAGTGKTVVLLHRANYLAETVFDDPNDRILVTTFTRNLALDLRQNLRNLASQDAFSRMEIVNLHSWAVGFMRNQGHSFKIASDYQAEALLEIAVSELGDPALSQSFYRDEWEQIVQGQDVASRDDYLTARRVGRGVRLSRKQRGQAWLVFQRYRELLDDEGLCEWPDVLRETRMYIEKQHIPSPYRAVLSDEVQDFSANELKLLRLLAPQEANTLFLVGDGHQRIYGKPVRLGACGIEIRGRSRRLKLNYRTTEQIRNHSVAILEGREIDDLDGGLDTLKGYHSLRQGPAARVELFSKDGDEVSFIVETIKTWMSEVPAESICLAVRTHNQLGERYEGILNDAGIETARVSTDPESEAQKNGVRLSTMHRLKGLEYSKVLLAGVQEENVPFVVKTDFDDADAEKQRELQERCLLYVAMTRARDELTICGFGRPSPFLLDTV